MKLVKCLFAVLAAALAAPGHAQQPVKVRIAWIVPVTNLASFMYTAKDVLRHHGKTYVAEAARFQGSTPQLTALGTGDLDVALLGFTSFPLAIQNARMEDLRIIADEIRDGVPGYYSNEFMVRKDSGIRSVADLKGKVLATNAAGSAVDVAMRAMLRKNNLDDKGFTVVEAAFPNMRAMLLEKKAELVPAVPPFAYNPELREASTVLFTEGQALGPNTLGIWVARRGFLREKPRRGDRHDGGLSAGRPVRHRSEEPELRGPARRRRHQDPSAGARGLALHRQGLLPPRGRSGGRAGAAVQPR